MALLTSYTYVTKGGPLAAWKWASARRITRPSNGRWFGGLLQSHVDTRRGRRSRRPCTAWSWLLLIGGAPAPGLGLGRCFEPRERGHCQPLYRQPVMTWLMARVTRALASIIRPDPPKALKRWGMALLEPGKAASG